MHGNFNKVKGVNSRNFIQVLKSEGFVLSRVNGSHWIYVHRDGREVIVVNKRNKSLQHNVLRYMLKCAGWLTEEDWVRVGLYKK